MTGTYKKPLPVLSDLNRPFWAAAAEGKIKIQKCTDCGATRYPIAHICPECLSEQTEWVELSGRGEVLSAIVFHQVYNEAFAKDVPYNVSLIQLEAGPRLFSNVVGIAPGKVRVGDKVEAVFERATDEFVIPRFRPVASGAAE